MPILGSGAVVVVDGSPRIETIRQPNKPQVLVLPAFDGRNDTVAGGFVRHTQHSTNVGSTELSDGFVNLTVLSKWSIDELENVEYSDDYTTPPGFSPAALSVGDDGYLHVTPIPA